MRYLPLSEADRVQMLTRIGADKIETFFADVPESAFDDFAGLSDGLSELAVEQHMSHLAAQNHTAEMGPFFLGCGAYRHHIPASVDHIIQRSEFMTSYTPYQAEIAQGTLQAMFEFQTQVAILAGMDIANASLHDGACACAEAALMACRVKKRSRVVLAGNLHPHYVKSTQTACQFRGVEIISLPSYADNPAQLFADACEEIDAQTACLIVQTPDVFGHLHDLRRIVEAAHAQGALLVAVSNEIVSLGLVQSPGEMGADIWAGEGQSLGIPLSFGGPHLGLLACNKAFMRQIPGRLVGQSLDADGERAFTLTLSAREQHIRRGRATSNVCTNAGLCALAFSAHLSLLGGTGLRNLAALNHARACQLAENLAKIPGIEVLNRHFFNELSCRTVIPAQNLIDSLAERGIIGGVAVSFLMPDAMMDDVFIICATEMNSPADIENLTLNLGEILA